MCLLGWNMQTEISMHVTTWLQRDVSGHWPHRSPTCVLRGGSFLESANRNEKPHRAAVFLTWTLLQVKNKITSTPKKDLAQSTALSKTESRTKGSHKDSRYHQHLGYSPGLPFPYTLTLQELWFRLWLFIFSQFLLLHALKSIYVMDNPRLGVHYTILMHDVEAKNHLMQSIVH